MVTRGEAAMEIIEYSSGDLNAQFCIERKTIRSLIPLFLSAMGIFSD
jgi:hypothetical protein